MQCCLADQRSWAFNAGFQPRRLRAEFSPENVLVILWAVADGTPYSLHLCIDKHSLTVVFALTVVLVLNFLHLCV